MLALSFPFNANHIETETKPCGSVVTGLTPRGGATPHSAVPGQTPLRTPARDKLNINVDNEYDDPEYAQYLQVCETPTSTALNN